MSFFKKNAEETISWNLTNGMKPNIGNYNSNYDKNIALKNFLVRNNLTLEQIAEIMNRKNPFWEAVKYFKQTGISGRIHDGQNVEEDNLFRYKKMLEIGIIENSKLDMIINQLFYAMIDSIIISAGYMYVTDGRGDPFSPSTYKDVLRNLSRGEVVIDDTIMTAFHIAFLISNKEMEEFLNLFDWSWNNCISSYANRFANRIGGIEYLKGLFYKNIENSINIHKKYNAKKIIDNNEIDTAKECDIKNILFSHNSDGNQILFKECFDDFKKDLLNIVNYIKEANKIRYNKLFDYEMNDEIIFNKENYFADYKPYTSTGRKSKYPLIINGIFEISNNNHVTVYISYNQKGKVSRLEFDMHNKNIHRVIIVKEINKELILSEIKEHNVMIDAFPNPIYKYNNSV